MIVVFVRTTPIYAIKQILDFVLWGSNAYCVRVLARFRARAVGFFISREAFHTALPFAAQLVCDRVRQFCVLRENFPRWGCVGIIAPEEWTSCPCWRWAGLCPSRVLHGARWVSLCACWALNRRRAHWPFYCACHNRVIWIWRIVSNYINNA